MRQNLRAAGDQALRSVRFMLALYAGCLFSASPWAGGFLLAATALQPFSALLAVLSVISALVTARTLHLLSDKSPPALYTYSALYVGLIANHTFGNPAVALGFATCGAAVSVILTASLRELGMRLGLPARSLPFVAVYLCAIGAGRSLAVSWAQAPAPSASLPAAVPDVVVSYLEALGALVCDGRAQVGLLVLLGLCAAGHRTLLLTVLGYGAALIAFQLFDLAPALRLVVTLNAMFTAVALASGWLAPTLRSYGLAFCGALFCALCTPGLSAPFARVELTPLSLPFNLTIYAVSLVTRQRIGQVQSETPSAALPHSVIA
jgi:urea transporter